MYVTFLSNSVWWERTSQLLCSPYWWQRASQILCSLFGCEETAQLLHSPCCCQYTFSCYTIYIDGNELLSDWAMRIVDSRLARVCAIHVDDNSHSSWFTFILDSNGLHEYCRIPVYDNGLLQSSEISVYFGNPKQWGAISKPVTCVTLNPEVTWSELKQPCTIPVNSFLLSFVIASVEIWVSVFYISHDCIGFFFQFFLHSKCWQMVPNILSCHYMLLM